MVFTALTLFFASTLRARVAAAIPAAPAPTTTISLTGQASRGVWHLPGRGPLNLRCCKEPVVLSAAEQAAHDIAEAAEEAFAFRP